nr:MAG TPA: hypothetical protein [Crassvirales sp.]
MSFEHEKSTQGALVSEDSQGSEQIAILQGLYTKTSELLQHG